MYRLPGILFETPEQCNLAGNIPPFYDICYVSMWNIIMTIILKFCVAKKNDIPVLRNHNAFFLNVQLSYTEHIFERDLCNMGKIIVNKF